MCIHREYWLSSHVDNCSDADNLPSIMQEAITQVVCFLFSFLDRYISWRVIIRPGRQARVLLLWWFSTFKAEKKRPLWGQNIKDKSWRV